MVIKIELKVNLMEINSQKEECMYSLKYIYALKITLNLIRV